MLYVSKGTMDERETPECLQHETSRNIHVGQSNELTNGEAPNEDVNFPEAEEDIGSDEEHREEEAEEVSTSSSSVNAIAYHLRNPNWISETSIDLSLLNKHTEE